MKSAPATGSFSRLLDKLVPTTSGGLYTLIPGTLGFFTVLWMYLDSYLTCKHLPGCTAPLTNPMSGEMLTATVTMLGVHTVRGVFADRANASQGYGPVPVEVPSEPQEAPASEPQDISEPPPPVNLVKAPNIPPFPPQ